MTNGAYVEFIDDGGYDDPRLLERGGLGVAAGERRSSTRSSGSARRRRLVAAPLRTLGGAADPTSRCSTCAGTRPRPTRAGPASACRPRRSGSARRVRARQRRYPWGDEFAGEANLGQRRSGRHRSARIPAGVSRWGVHQLLGDVWEWTASDFAPYPGFASFPYREYSEVFFGPDYKVLRGGSWATHPLAIRTTFRNWDYPIRRQIFAGFRSARDAEPSDARRRPVDVHLTPDERVAALRDDVAPGSPRRRRSCRRKWFYDERGSELFDEITRLPEYYPTRCERAILTARRDEIAAANQRRHARRAGLGHIRQDALLLDALDRGRFLAASCRST